MTEKQPLDLICGWEPRESIGVAVCAHSAVRLSTLPLRFTPLSEPSLRLSGLYRRPHEDRNGQLFDTISEAPMATTFANSRFLTPWLVDKNTQWALFCDFVDMLFLADPADLFRLADPEFAIMVVKHSHAGDEQTKMDNQAQTQYQRKNWSSVILWNLQHRSNQRLDIEMVNTLPGRQLHRFCWLRDEEIGELPLEWNYLVGVNPVSEGELGVKPKLLHWTLGLPVMSGYENASFAAEWRAELALLDRTRKRIGVQLDGG